MTKFEKETRYKLYVFIKNQQSTQRNTIQHHTLMTRSVHLHGHDVLPVPLTVLLHCPIKSMKRMLSY